MRTLKFLISTGAAALMVAAIGIAAIATGVSATDRKPATDDKDKGGLMSKRIGL